MSGQSKMTANAPVAASLPASGRMHASSPTCPTRALVLSSGGIDSTTCLALAVERFSTANVSTVSFFYGQRHRKELDAAQAVAERYGVAHYMLDIASVLRYSDNALMAGSTQDVARGTYADQKDAVGRPNTYVPFRNGLMLSAAAALAASLYPDEACAVYLGAHADDAAGDAYPDCSPAFTDAMSDAMRIGTYGNVTLEAPFVNDTKAGVVACGLERGVPYELTWSCYEGGDVACGTCGTCLDRIAAFHANGAEDPIRYSSAPDGASAL